jgi:hypothetical protein
LGDSGMMMKQVNNPFLNIDRTASSSSSGGGGGGGGDIELGSTSHHDSSVPAGDGGGDGVGGTDGNMRGGDWSVHDHEGQMSNGIPVNLYYLLASLGATPFVSPASSSYEGGHVLSNSNNDDEYSKGHEVVTCFGLLDTKEKKLLASKVYLVIIRIFIAVSIAYMMLRSVCHLSSLSPYTYHNIYIFTTTFLQSLFFFLSSSSSSSLASIYLSIYLYVCIRHTQLVGMFLTPKQQVESGSYRQDFTCSSSAVYRDGQAPPCLYVYAGFGMSVCLVFF